MRRGAIRRRPVNQNGRSSPDWYLDFAYDEVKALADAGKLGDDRVLVVRTGLDGNLQTKAESVIEDMLRVNAPAYRAHQAAAVVADTDGLVRAMVGGRDYGASQFNRATEAARQPGSSFKIFDYMTALLTGKYHKDTTVQAGGICIGDYCVHNFGGESGGAMPLYQALAQSYNTAAIWISVKIGEVYWPAGKPYHQAKIAELGRSKIIETARKMGLTTPLVDTVSLPVGADEVKMIDMVAANALLANGGKRATPYAAIEIRNSAGEAIYTHAANGTPPVQVLPPDKVAEMNNIMTHVLTEGTGRGAQIPGLVIAGKTGTTNGPTNAWFNGFTGNLVGSVWFGNDDNSAMTGNMQGGALPAQTWRAIMAYAHQGIEAKPPFGVAAPAPGAAEEIAAAPAAKGGAGVVEPPRQIGLSPHSARIILEIAEIARAAETRAAALGSPGEYAARTNDGTTIVRGGVMAP
jgi:penicillin-binding protein 1A